MAFVRSNPLVHSSVYRMVLSFCFLFSHYLATDPPIMEWKLLHTKSFEFITSLLAKEKALWDAGMFTAR